jgi:hypothetical protein
VEYFATMMVGETDDTGGKGEGGRRRAGGHGFEGGFGEDFHSGGGSRDTDV